MTKAFSLDDRTILRGIVGSTAHGLNVNDGLEDRDEMAVCVEPFDNVVGFQHFEQSIYRTAAVREGKADARSSGGDLDLVTYSLRKYLRLALKGNPTILLLLFLPEELCVVRSSLGRQLQELASSIISKRALFAFLGYLSNQRERLIGKRGQKDCNRPELVERYGFDTKYAMHMLRLGYQGVELGKTGRLSLPMPKEQREWLRSVRTGGVSLEACLSKCEMLEWELMNLKKTSSLPSDPLVPIVEQWMLDTYRRTWETDQLPVRNLM